MAGMARPVIEIKIQDDTVELISKVSFFNHVVSFKIDGPYKQSFEGIEMDVSKTHGIH